MLLYANDIVSMSPNVSKAQQQLDVRVQWCEKWLVKIIAKKSQVVHKRNYQKPRATPPLCCCGQKLEYTDRYKYLGYILNECLSKDKCVEALNSAASRSFGRIVNMFKVLKNMGINTYEMLFGSYMQPIMNYATGFWGSSEQSSAQVLQNRIQRLLSWCKSLHACCSQQS